MYSVPVFLLFTGFNAVVGTHLLSHNAPLIFLTVNVQQTQDYMTYNAGLVVLPSLLEVCLEVRNFFKQQQQLRQMSVQTPGMEMSRIEA